MNEVKTLSGRAIKWAKGIKHIVPPASDDAQEIADSEL